jgi:hypothetical protein
MTPQSKRVCNVKKIYPKHLTTIFDAFYTLSFEKNKFDTWATSLPLAKWMQKLTSLLCINIHIILIAQILPKTLAHQSMFKGVTRVEWNLELKYGLGLLDNGHDLVSPTLPSLFILVVLLYFLFH